MEKVTLEGRELERVQGIDRKLQSLCQEIGTLEISYLKSKTRLLSNLKETEAQFQILIGEVRQNRAIPDVWHFDPQTCTFYPPGGTPSGANVKTEEPKNG